MKFLILFTLISYSVMAQDPLTSECTQAAMRFGNGEGDDYVSKDCFDWVKQNKTDQNSISMADKIQVIGHLNLIFISEFKEGKYLTHIIAGKSSGLKNIKAMSLSLEHRELYVLQGQELLVFSMDITGNVGPMRKFQSSTLAPADSVTYLAEGEQLKIGVSGLGKIYPRLIRSK